jgi:membrane protein DedA with SNARE-associated domain
MVHALLNLVNTYGYVAVGALVMIESLGIPFPGESALLAGAALAGAGQLSLPGVIAAAATGAVLGDACAYWIGRRGGIALVRRYGRRVGVGESALDVARAFYARHGGKTVFFGRFISLLRMLAALLAGAGRMPYGRFAVFNVLGAVCWATTIALLGYWFGHSLPALHRTIGRVGLLVALLVALAASLFLLWRWVERHRDRLLAAAAAMGRAARALPAAGALGRRFPALGRFIAARLAPGRYLGLHLTVGMLASVLALALFADIADDVTDREGMQQLDQALADLLHRHAEPWLVTACKVLSAAGSAGAIVLLGILAAVALAVRRQKLMLAGWAAGLIGAALLNEGLKLAFRRPRPHFDVPFVSLHSWSFPSAHAMVSLVAYGLLAYLVIALWIRRRAARAAVAAVAALLVVLVGFSRLCLGAHYLTDVLGGYAAGLVWLSACITGLETARLAGTRSR